MNTRKIEKLENAIKKAITILSTDASASQTSTQRRLNALAVLKEATCSAS